jgi:hypothetical protein
MLPLLSLHALAAKRGDGLRPELLALFERGGQPSSGLVAAIEPADAKPCRRVDEAAPEDVEAK